MLHGYLLTHLALVESDGPFSQQALVNLHCTPNVIPLRLFVDVTVIHPAVPVRGHLPVGSFFESVAHGRVALQCLRNNKITSRRVDRL